MTSNPPLNDGRLDVNGTLSFANLYQAVISCHAASEQVPIGPFLSPVASAVLAKYGIVVDPQILAAFIGFAGSFSLTITRDAGTAYIGGSIMNWGGLLCGSNNPVEVYVRESLLNYRLSSSCVVEAPLGLFVETRP